MKKFLLLFILSVISIRAFAEVRPAEEATETAVVPPSPAVSVLHPAADKFERTFAGRLGPHESIYFIYGSDAPAAKFQFSFKYKILTFGEATSQRIPSTLQFAFSQRSLWDITGTSSPFYDTSYMPELFYESLAPVSEKSGGLTWLGFQAGYKHESNGRAGPVSRSLNTLFVQPVFSFGTLEGWHLIVIPKIFTYVGGLGDNAGLKDYHGYGQLRFVIGEKNSGPSLMYSGIVGQHWSHLTSQIDFTVPVRTSLLDFETYLLVQYFNGYGESLLSYRDKSETIRTGFSLVR